MHMPVGFARQLARPENNTSQEPRGQEVAYGRAIVGSMNWFVAKSAEVRPGFNFSPSPSKIGMAKARNSSMRCESKLPNVPSGLFSMSPFSYASATSASA